MYLNNKKINLSLFNLENTILNNNEYNENNNRHKKMSLKNCNIVFAYLYKTI